MNLQNEVGKELQDKLFEACRKNDLEGARQLLLAGANPNSIDANGQSPLVIVSVLGFPILCELLITYKADVNMPALNKLPLSYAIASCQDEIVLSLVSAGGREE